MAGLAFLQADVTSGRSAGLLRQTDFSHALLPTNALLTVGRMTKAKPTKRKSEYTIPDVARMFGVTRECVRQWILEGKMRARRPGWNYFVKAADCQRPPKGKTGPKGPWKRKAKGKHRGQRIK
jgi:excisionase family DNA binding protein